MAGICCKGNTDSVEEKADPSKDQKHNYISSIVKKGLNMSVNENSSSGNNCEVKIKNYTKTVSSKKSSSEIIPECGGGWFLPQWNNSVNALLNQHKVAHNDRQLNSTTPCWNCGPIQQQRGEAVPFPASTTPPATEVQSTPAAQTAETSISTQEVGSSSVTEVEVAAADHTDTDQSATESKQIHCLPINQEIDGSEESNAEISLDVQQALPLTSAQPMESTLDQETDSSAQSEASAENLSSGSDRGTVDPPAAFSSAEFDCSALIITAEQELVEDKRDMQDGTHCATLPAAMPVAMERRAPASSNDIVTLTSGQISSMQERAGANVPCKTEEIKSTIEAKNVMSLVVNYKCSFSIPGSIGMRKDGAQVVDVSIKSMQTSAAYSAAQLSELTIGWEIFHSHSNFVSITSTAPYSFAKYMCDGHFTVQVVPESPAHYKLGMSSPITSMPSHTTVDKFSCTCSNLSCKPYNPRKSLAVTYSRSSDACSNALASDSVIKVVWLVALISHGVSGPLSSPCCGLYCLEVIKFLAAPSLASAAYTCTDYEDCQKSPCRNITSFITNTIEFPDNPAFSHYHQPSSSLDLTIIIKTIEFPDNPAFSHYHKPSSSLDLKYVFLVIGQFRSHPTCSLQQPMKYNDLRQFSSLHFCGIPFQTAATSNRISHPSADPLLVSSSQPESSWELTVKQLVWQGGFNVGSLVSAADIPLLVSTKNVSNCNFIFLSQLDWTRVSSLELSTKVIQNSPVKQTLRTDMLHVQVTAAEPAFTSQESHSSHQYVLLCHTQSLAIPEARSRSHYGKHTSPCQDVSSLWSSFQGSSCGSKLSSRCGDNNKESTVSLLEQPVKIFSHITQGKPQLWKHYISTIDSEGCCSTKDVLQIQNLFKHADKIDSNGTDLKGEISNPTRIRMDEQESQHYHKSRIKCCQTRTSTCSSQCRERGIGKVGVASSSLSTSSSNGGPDLAVNNPEEKRKVKDSKVSMPARGERKHLRSLVLPQSAPGLLISTFFSLLIPGACSSGGSGMTNSCLSDQIFAFLSCILQCIEDPTGKSMMIGLMVLFITTLLLFCIFHCRRSRNGPQEEQNWEPNSSLMSFSSSRGSTLVIPVQCTDATTMEPSTEQNPPEASRRKADESDEDSECAEEVNGSNPDAHVFVVSYKQCGDNSIVPYGDSTNSKLVYASDFSTLYSSGGTHQYLSTMVGLPSLNHWQGQLAHMPQSPSSHSKSGSAGTTTKNVGEVHIASGDVDPHNLKATICNAEKGFLDEALEFSAQPGDLSSSSHYQLTPMSPATVHKRLQNQRLNLPSDCDIQVAGGSIKDMACTDNVNVPCASSLISLNCCAGETSLFDKGLHFGTLDSPLQSENSTIPPSDVEQDGNISDMTLKYFVAQCGEDSSTTDDLHFY